MQPFKFFILFLFLLPLSAQKAISLAPNLTESMFALGLEDHLVGVTQYCTYPEAAKKIAKVGGYLDPSMETLVALKPDVILCLPEHQPLFSQFDALKIKYVAIKNYSISDVYDTFQTLGKTFNAQDKAQNLIASLKEALQEQRCSWTEKKTCLLVIGREYGQPIQDVFVVGTKGFMAELLDLAGGKSIAPEGLHFPQLGPEGLLALNPDYIIDITPILHDIAPETLLEDWQTMSQLKAVQQKQIRVLTGSHLMVPGPRMDETLKHIRGALNCNHR